MQLELFTQDGKDAPADVERRVAAWCAWFDALEALGGNDAAWADVRALDEREREAVTHG